MCVGKLNLSLYPFKFTASEAFLSTETDLFTFKGTVFVPFYTKKNSCVSLETGDHLKWFGSEANTGFSGMLSTGKSCPESSQSSTSSRVTGQTLSPPGRTVMGHRSKESPQKPSKMRDQPCPGCCL